MELINVQFINRQYALTWTTNDDDTDHIRLMDG